MNCIDQTLQNALGVLQRLGNIQDGFANPQHGILLDMGSAGWLKLPDLAAIIAGIDPLNVLNAPILTALNCVQTQLTAVVGTGSGNFGGSLAGKTMSMTNFLSGRTDFFPHKALKGLAGVSSKYNLLKGMGFVTVLGIAKGGLSLNDNLCTTDPDDPCKEVSKMFGMVLGPFNATLNAMHAGISQMDDWVNKAQQYCDMLNGFIATLTQALVDSINAIISTLVRVMQYGLAKLLETLLGDPCISQVLNQVMVADLKDAFVLPTPPSVQVL